MILRPQDITLDRLSEDRTEKDFGESIAEFQKYALVGDAHELYITLKRLLASPEAAQDTGLQETYDPVVSYLGILSLPLCTEEEVTGLLSKRLVFAIERKVDLLRLINHFFDVYRDNVLDGRLRRKIIEAIARGEEHIGSQPIVRQGQRLSPTVGHWIQDLMVQYKLGQEMSGLEELEYIGKQRHLDTKSRNILQEVFRVYNSIRFPKFRREVSGNEDITDRQPVRSVIARQPRPDKSLTQIFSEAAKFMTPIYQEEKGVQGRTGNEPAKVKKQLVDSLKQRNPDQLSACLLLLARSGSLQDALKQSASWRDTVGTYLQKRYPDVDLRFFVENNPTSPVVISEFLQYLLQDRLGLPEDRAAIIGMELGDIMGDGYRMMAYADEAQGTFRWVEHKVDGGRLVDDI